MERYIVVDVRREAKRLFGYVFDCSVTGGKPPLSFPECGQSLTLSWYAHMSGFSSSVPPKRLRTGG